MIVLVLGDEEGQQVLDRLLSSPLAPVPAGRHSLSLRNVPWSEEERDVIRGCASALEARRAYRAAYPESDRTDDAIARQYFGCTHPPKGEGAEVETETLDEPVEPEVAEETEAPDLSRLDPALAGLRDEDLSETPAPSPQCTGEEVTLSAPSQQPEPEPEKKKRKPRKDAWTEEEETAIAECASPEEARAAYRRVHPERCRTDDAIKGRWNLLQKRPRVGKTVRIDLPNSSMHGALGTVLKISDQGNCLVSVGGSPASIWVAPERLTGVQQEEGSK